MRICNTITYDSYENKYGIGYDPKITLCYKVPLTYVMGSWQHILFIFERILLTLVT